MPRNRRGRRPAISRRTFLKYGVGAGMLLGAGSLLEAPRRVQARGTNATTERRTYFFNLSHLDTSAHDLILVAGKHRVRLNRTPPQVLRNARLAHPILNQVPNEHITHHVLVEMSTA